MATSLLQVRVEGSLKDEAAQVFERLEIDICRWMKPMPRLKPPEVRGRYPVNEILRSIGHCCQQRRQKKCRN